MDNDTTRIEFRPLLVAGVYAALPQPERDALAEWEAANLDGHTVATSDWPGWDKYIGPVKDTAPLYKKQEIPRQLRALVFARDDHRCVRCGSRKQLCADHIYPERKGGATTLDNLQTLCNLCNVRKGMKV